MLPLFLKDGLLVPYVVTSLAFLFFSIYLLSALEHCSEEELRLGAYHKLLFFLPKLDLACIVRWKVSVVGLQYTALILWSASQKTFICKSFSHFAIYIPQNIIV